MLTLDIKIKRLGLRAITKVPRLELFDQVKNPSNAFHYLHTVIVHINTMKTT